MRSLRWHYPDQVLRVGVGGRWTVTPSQPGSPGSPACYSVCGPTIGAELQVELYYTLVRWQSSAPGRALQLRHRRGRTDALDFSDDAPALRLRGGPFQTSAQITQFALACLSPDSFSIGLRPHLLLLSISWIYSLEHPREGNGLPQMVYTADPGYRTLHSQAEARVWD